jgi:hypothetical protein
MDPENRFQGMNSASLSSLAVWYDNPIPPRFLAPIDCLKIQFCLQKNMKQNSSVNSITWNGSPWWWPRCHGIDIQTVTSLHTWTPMGHPTAPFVAFAASLHRTKQELRCVKLTDTIMIIFVDGSSAYTIIQYMLSDYRWCGLALGKPSYTLIHKIHRYP